MEVRMDGGRAGGVEGQEADTVARVSADTGGTERGSQRALWVEVCQSCIDVWGGGVSGPLTDATVRP